MDQYAVSVVKEGNITVGHLPKKISRVCSLFLQRGGTISCEITGRRQYSSDFEARWFRSSLFDYKGK